MVHDLIIIGAGPAGITAGIYAVRYGLDTLVLEKDVVSGQISSAKIVENYPGISSISGMDLMDSFTSHALKTGVNIQNSEVESITGAEGVFVVHTLEGDLSTRSIIVATGAAPRRLGVSGEDTFLGRGVSYCETCDGPLFSGRSVIVVGGGESAITGAIDLSNIASKVYVVHRRDTLRASKVLQDRAFSRSNIEFVYNSVLEMISGSTVVEVATIRNVETNAVEELSVDGVFIYVGITPNTGFVDVEKDRTGFIVTNEMMETSRKGIFAAGDCRTSSLKQVITAAGDGAVAADQVRKYMIELSISPQ
ncbi:MAG: thioredoxin-disulfide reductase [Methanosarcinaceae archaeon]|nr:thioredoxin-disulfide reductase [Methanosarcinaceae archaeon]